MLAVLQTAYKIMTGELTTERLPPIRTVMPAGPANIKVKGVIIFIMSGNEFKDKDLTQPDDFETAVSTYVAACITTHDTYETVLVITPALNAVDTAQQEGGVGTGYKKVVRAIEEMLTHARIHFLNADHLSPDFKKDPIFRGPGSDRWHVATQANLSTMVQGVLWTQLRQLLRATQ